MTLEDRVSRLEQRVDELGRIEQDLTNVRTELAAFRSDFAAYRAENEAVLSRILATLEQNYGPPIAFRWPWERAGPRSTSPSS
jgi:hypothetical protein